MILRLPTSKAAAITRIGVDAHFAMGTIRAGLYYHHRHLFRELRRLERYEITLFVNRWANRGQRAGEGIARLRSAFQDLPIRTAAVPGKLQRLRMAFSPLSRVHVFYHVVGSEFGPVPGAVNVFLIPDIIPLVIDYPDLNYRRDCRHYFETAVRHGAVIFVYTEHTKQDIVQQLGADPQRIVITPLSAGPEFRPIADRDRLRVYLHRIGIGDCPYILTVGTIEPRKNYATLIHALRHLKRTACPHKLVISGAAWEGLDELRRLAAAAGVADDVVFLGYGEELELLYNGAAVFVFPSLYEGFGLPPLEAMACGVPVVASNATSIPEVVGDAALLVDPLDPVQIGEAMRRVLEDENLAQSLRQRGLQRAGQFNWSQTARSFARGIDQARVEYVSG